MKLNRKGFTLIELLAVVVILAVILVVTIPSVLNTMDTAKTKQFQNAADSMAEWFSKEYELATLNSADVGTPSSVYTSFGGVTSTEKDLTPAVMKEAGITNTNGLTGKVSLNGAKICIELTADNTSNFYVANKTSVQSSGC